MAQSNEPLFGITASDDDQMVIFVGGIAFKVGGVVVGAVGCRGGEPDRNDEVAAAGLAAFKPGALVVFMFDEIPNSASRVGAARCGRAVTAIQAKASSLRQPSRLLRCR